MRPLRRPLGLLALVGAACLPALVVHAQPVPPSHAYPLKPVRWIVPFAAGGPTDVVARLVAARLAEVWGQPMVIDNRAGASGMIGSELVARAAPDGYTLLVGSGTSLTSAPALRLKVPYDAARDFVPVSLMVVNPQVLVAHPAVPVKSIKDLIDVAKARPGQLNYASGGEGATPHLSMELLRAMTGINVVHVPYKGSGPALIDLLAGQVQLAFNSMQPSVLAMVRSGKLTALGVSTLKRSPAAPDIPAIAETVPGFENNAWYGVFFPARTPGRIVARMNAEIVRSLSDPEISQRLRAEGAEPAPGTPEALRQFMTAEAERLRRVIQFAGIKPR